VPEPDDENDEIVPEPDGKNDEIVPEPDGKNDEIVPEPDGKNDEIVPEPDGKNDEIVPGNEGKTQTTNLSVGPEKSESWEKTGTPMTNMSFPGNDKYVTPMYSENTSRTTYTVGKKTPVFPNIQNDVESDDDEPTPTALLGPSPTEVESDATSVPAEDDSSDVQEKEKNWDPRSHRRSVNENSKSKGKFEERGATKHTQISTDGLPAEHPARILLATVEKMTGRRSRMTQSQHGSASQCPTPPDFRRPSLGSNDRPGPRTHIRVYHHSSACHFSSANFS
jgi:hypothetical protein